MTIAPPAPPPTTEPPKTADGKPRPAKLDKKRIAADAAREVATTLESIEDTKRRLKQATVIIDKAHDFLDDETAVVDGKEVIVTPGAERRMKSMALYLSETLGGVAVYNATSMSRYAFYKMVRAHKGRILVHRNAERELPVLATEVIQAHAWLAEATKFRDAAIIELIDGPAKMKHSEVAELIGRERSRVTQIVSEAKKRAKSA